MTSGTIEITRIAERLYAIEPEAGVAQRYSNPSYVVMGEKIAVVEPGATVAADNLLAGLAQIGVHPRDVDLLCVTHVHLDHAAAAGYLAEKMPRAVIAVHEKGLPHLADPARLRAAATDSYGISAESRYGAILPVPRDRLVALGDGQSFGLGRGLSLRAIYTPGHAPHHYSFFEECHGVLFSGEAFPLYLPEADVILPCVSPPYLDVEPAVSSVSKLAALCPAVLACPNGIVRGDLMPLFERAAAVLRRWSDLVREAMQEEPTVEHVRGRLLDDLTAAMSPYQMADLSPVNQDLLRWHLEFATTGYMEFHRRHGRP